MTKVLVISDSHGSMDNVRKIKKKTGEMDLVIHLGDIVGQEEILRKIYSCQVVIVKGNCDFYSENKNTEIIDVEGCKIFATHGHHYGVDWGLDRLAYAAQERGCNIAMYGHTHVPEVNYLEGIMVLNPGSVTRPRQLNRKPTYILMELSKNQEPKFDIQYV